MTLTSECQHHGSYVDPGGRVFERDNVVLRAINPGYAEFYAGLMKNPSVAAMLGREIVETEPEPSGISGYPLTLRHRRIAPVSYAYEWSTAMLRDAGLLTLDICSRLVDQQLTLQDASPWNVLFGGPRPVFVDFTSIVPEDPNLVWVAYDQFCRFFLSPLILSSQVPHSMGRLLLMDSINGVGVEDLLRLLRKSAILRMPWLVRRFFAPYWTLSLLRHMGTDKGISRFATQLRPNAAARKVFFAGLRRDLESIPVRCGRSRWSSYYADIESFWRASDFNPKQVAVVRVLETCQPRTVTDIGCNMGGYSILAARAGARVVAFDSDEACISLLYRAAQEKQLSILPLVMDVLNPSPACGWRALQFPAALERFRSEMAMALALVHHLAITQRQTFERIVPALADYAATWLLTEFVPLDDPRSKELLVTHRRDMSWYTLENFTRALGETFSQVETFSSYPEGRVLVLCRR